MERERGKRKEKNQKKDHSILINSLFKYKRTISKMPESPLFHPFHISLIIIISSQTKNRVWKQDEQRQHEIKNNAGREK